MLPIILASLFVAQTNPPAEWPSYVTQNGRTYEKAEESLPMVHQIHRQFWERPGCGNPSNAVPAAEQLSTIPTLSIGRWTNAPCYFAYTYRLTNDEIDQLTIPELCTEMDMARCWDDTHYLARLTASLATRFPELKKHPRGVDPAFDARVDTNHLFPATADEVNAWATGRITVGMTMMEVLLTARVGITYNSTRSDSPLGTQKVYRYCAVDVAPGAPDKPTADALADEWGVLQILARHRMTARTIATITTLHKPGEPAEQVTWWNTEGDGFDARTAGMARWRAAVLAEAPNLFTKEPPPPPAHNPAASTDPTATLPGDFSKPLPTTPPTTPPSTPTTPPTTRPTDPNKPAPSLPPTPQPPPDR